MNLTQSLQIIYRVEKVVKANRQNKESSEKSLFYHPCPETSNVILLFLQDQGLRFESLLT